MCQRPAAAPPWPARGERSIVIASGGEWEEALLGAALGRALWESSSQARFRRRRYCAAILLHCSSADCLSEASGIFAAAVRQLCFALLSALLTFALLVVI